MGKNPPAKLVGKEAKQGAPKASAGTKRPWNPSPQKQSSGSFQASGSPVKKKPKKQPSQAAVANPAFKAFTIPRLVIQVESIPTFTHCLDTLTKEVTLMEDQSVTRALLALSSCLKYVNPNRTLTLDHAKEVSNVFVTKLTTLYQNTPVTMIRVLASYLNQLLGWFLDANTPVTFEWQLFIGRLVQGMDTALHHVFMHDNVFCSAFLIKLCQVLSRSATQSQKLTTAFREIGLQFLAHAITPVTLPIKFFYSVKGKADTAQFDIFLVSENGPSLEHTHNMEILSADVEFFRNALKSRKPSPGFGSASNPTPQVNGNGINYGGVNPTRRRELSPPGPEDSDMDLYD